MSSAFPSTYIEGIEVKQTPNRGATAFAARDFAVGEVVLCEEPALVIVDGKQCRDSNPFVQFAHDNNTDDELWEVLGPASMLPVEKLKALMEGLYSPLVIDAAPFYEAPHASGDAKPAQQVVPTDSFGMPVSVREAELCEKLFSSSPSTFAKYFPSSAPSFSYWSAIRDLIIGADKDAKRSAVFDVLRFLHGCRINYHSQESSSLKCIFPRCCKLSHHCNPNTFWRMHKETDVSEKGVIRCAHIAVRPIRKDEELSFSYCGTGINMLADTSRRRDSLYPLGFVCRCDRCLTYDHSTETSRALKCLACGALAVTLGTNNAWACKDCPFSISPENFVDAGVVLSTETIFEALVLTVMFKDQKQSTRTLLDRASRHSLLGPVLAAVQGAPNPLVRRWIIVQNVKTLLGPSHFLFPVALLGLMRAIVTAIMTPAALADFVGFVGDDRKRVASAKGSSFSSPVWLDTLFADWVALADAWFVNNMSHSSQHYMLWAFASDISGAVIAKRPIALNAEEMSAATIAKDSMPAGVSRGLQALAGFEEWRR